MNGLRGQLLGETGLSLTNNVLYVNKLSYIIRFPRLTFGIPSFITYIVFRLTAFHAVSVQQWRDYFWGIFCFTVHFWYIWWINRSHNQTFNVPSNVQMPNFKCKMLMEKNRALGHKSPNQIPIALHSFTIKDLQQSAISMTFCLVMQKAIAWLRFSFDKFRNDFDKVNQIPLIDTDG